MSTRWYPIYQRGNPQLRIFLPNFWMKLMKPAYHQPDNVVQFNCSLQMTRYDVQNYLEKIYKIPVAHVKIRIQMGEFKKDKGKGYITKDEDLKIAYVELKEGEKFVFPNLFPDEERKKMDKESKAYDQMQKDFKKYIDKNSDRPGLPSWYSF